jgi:VanZ family protein
MRESSTRGLARFIRIVWVCYAIALMIATHIPVPDDLETLVSLYDKLLHAGAYFGLGLLTYLSLMDFRTGRLAILPVYAGLLLFAAQDEYLQGFVNRTPDVQDWISDALATLAALCCLRFVMPRLCGSRSRLDALHTPESSSSAEHPPLTRTGPS